MHKTAQFRHLSLLALIALLIFFPSSPSFPSDEPFTGPNNWGGTGLMEIPTARVLKEDTFRFGLSQIYPYRYYYGAISPLNGLEIVMRTTEILGTKIETPGWEDYGNYKDKALDIMYQVIPEGKYTPAFTIGIMDPHGTRLYSSQYLVVSKQIYPFDFTLGLGNGRFGEEPLPAQGESFKIEMFDDTENWLKDSRFFGGIQFALSDKFSFMLEYNPILYHKQTRDPAWGKNFKEPVPLNYNIGLRYNLWDWAEIDLSYQRGEAFGINLSMPFEIGRQMIPIYDSPYKEPLANKNLLFSYRLLGALASSGFSDIGIDIQKRSIIIDLQNNKWFYNTKALEVVLSTIEPIIPEEIEDITIILKENGIPLFSLQLKKIDLFDYVQEELTREEFYFSSNLSTHYITIPDNRKYFKPGIALGYRPKFELFLNDPSGFWKGKVGLSLWSSYGLWDGGSLVAGLGIYPFTNVSTNNEPLSIPVRSDIVDYLDNKILFESLLFNQIYRIPNTNIFTRFSTGYLELQYAGLDGEVASPLLDGRLIVGVSGSAVKKRDPDNPILMKDDDVKDIYTTAFFNTRLNVLNPDVSLDIKYGRFLAGDVGAKFTISKFIKGVTLSAWYSFTDTSVFSDDFNRGYHEKGIAVLIPIRLFKGKDSKAVFGQAISPWTRDVAQDIGHFSSLFDFIGRNTKLFLQKDIGAE